MKEMTSTQWSKQIELIITIKFYTAQLNHVNLLMQDINFFYRCPANNPDVFINIELKRSDMAIIELSKKELSDISGGSGIPAPISTFFYALYSIPLWFGDIADKLFSVFNKQAKETPMSAVATTKSQLACEYRAKPL